MVMRLAFTIVVLDPKENFIQFLDPSRCHVKEQHKLDGLRTLELEYAFEDYNKDKELFSIGNKIWVQSDENINDCLYVINTEVEQNIYNKNLFSLDIEEVLVELNNAPVFFQTELTTDNGFKLRTQNGVAQVKVEWNALKYWFGDYFNIGVVQDCLTDYVGWINITGSINRMSLLRKLEEETGNIFVTRYEKDVLDNTIHRYLDFLNPINASKNWTLNLEYDFIASNTLSPWYDEDGDPTSETKFHEARKFNDGLAEGSVPEYIYDAETAPDWYVKGTEDSTYEYNPKNETTPLYDYITDYKIPADINPENMVFRITDEQGSPIESLIWTSEDVGFDETVEKAVITLCSVHEVLGVCINTKSFAILPDDFTDEDLASYVDYTETIYEDMDDDNTRSNIVLPDDCYFEMYDTVYHKVFFRTCINREAGHVHEDVLDFNFNMSNIEFDIDESTTYAAVTPVIEQKQTDDNSSLSRTDIDTLIVRWKNLAVQKGDVIPMIVERSFQQAATWSAAVSALGTVDPATNYWQKPFKQQNQLNDTDSSQNKWEVWKATAYWKAPFTKNAGEMFITTEDITDIQYKNVFCRPDLRKEKAVTTPKMGTTTTSDEDIYLIYNQVALYLKGHMTPKVDLEVDVANLQDGVYNNYQVHDKVYIKLPNSRELVTARVTETKKEVNDPHNNKIKLSNYTNRNTIQIIQHSTHIIAENTSFKYPSTKTITIRLENLEYDETDPYSVHYLGNKLLSLSLYQVENGQSTFKKVYTKRTNANGNISLAMNYDPGDYKLKIYFSGDEEYAECELTIKINVSGVKEVVELKITKPEEINREEVKAEISGSTAYWDKYGRSPDKAKLLAIGRISASRDKGSYANFYETAFKNWCPHCGKSTLTWGIFYAGNEYSNWGKFPATGRKEGGSAEGHIFCTNCDADYSCQGYEHVSGGKALSRTKDTILSSKEKAYELRNGKRIYSTNWIGADDEGYGGNVNRRVINTIDASVRRQALAIVGNKTGLSAAKAIASWMDNNISYANYENFRRSASKSLSMKSCNCCDGTRLYFELCDSAGCTEFLKLEYIHVYGHVYGRVTVKSTGSWTNVDNASTLPAWGYVCRDYQGRAIIHKTTYPARPF